MAKIKRRASGAKIDPHLEEQFLTGRLYGKISMYSTLPSCVHRLSITLACNWSHDLTVQLSAFCVTRDQK